MLGFPSSDFFNSLFKPATTSAIDSQVHKQPIVTPTYYKPTVQRSVTPIVSASATNVLPGTQQASSAVTTIIEPAPTAYFPISPVHNSHWLLWLAGAGAIGLAIILKLRKKHV